MALNIKDAETDRLARELSAVAGESLTVATRTALAERLERLQRRAGRSAQRAEILALIELGRSEPDRDPRSHEEIVGYDETGLPT